MLLWDLLLFQQSIKKLAIRSFYFDLALPPVPAHNILLCNCNVASESVLLLQHLHFQAGGDSRKAEKGQAQEGG